MMIIREDYMMSIELQDLILNELQKLVRRPFDREAENSSELHKCR